MKSRIYTETHTEEKPGLWAVRDTELWALMFALAGENPDKELVPRLKPELGVVYRIGEIDVPASRIKDLGENEGFLDIVGQLSFAACPKCESVNFSVALRCPNCGKQALSKSEMVIHYECGHLSPLQMIVGPGRNIYTCPNCGKLMKRIGIDYGRPGLGFTCPECKEVSQYPIVKLTCNRGHEVKIDESELQVFSVYKLGRALRTIPKIIPMLSEIKAKLSSSERNCIILANVTGESGNVHNAPLLVPGIPPVVADFILDRSTWEFQVLGTIRKTADLHVKSLLVVRKELEERVRDMINPQKIQVLTFEKEDEIVDSVVDAVHEMLTTQVALDKIHSVRSKSREP